MRELIFQVHSSLHTLRVGRHPSKGRGVGGGYCQEFWPGWLCQGWAGLGPWALLEGSGWFSVVASQRVAVSRTTLLSLEFR